MKGSEIQNLVFSLSIFGYKRSDIKSFLREISEYVLNLETKIYNLERERDELKNDIKEDGKNQIKFKEMIISAQDYKKKLEKEARLRAEEIINKARKQYEEIIKNTEKEEAKFKKIRRELDILLKNLFDNIQNYANIMDSKSKNMFLKDKPTYRSIENEKIEKEEYDLKKMIRIPEEKDEKSEEGETLEFDTTKNEKNNIEEDNSYIKTKFKEIDLR